MTEMNYNYLKSTHYALFNMYSAIHINTLYRSINLFKLTYSITKNILRGLKYFLLYICKNTRLSRREKNKIVFFALSKNQLDALKPIYNILKTQSIILSYKKNHDNTVTLMPLFIPLFISYLYAPKYLYFYFKASSEERKIFKVFFDEILLSLSYYSFCKIYLRWLSPKAIVFGNDHIFYTRIFVDLAEQNGVKCFYIQHASVTEIFPKIFCSYAFLEGQDSKEKYLKVGSDEEKIKLIGMPKLDAHIKYINKNKKIERLGICTTNSVRKQEIINMILFIRNKFPDLKLTFRPHPRENMRKKFKEIVNLQDIEISNSKIIDVFSFLKKVDAIISGNSSVLLEAALFNVFPIYYFETPNSKFKDQLYDKYGYIKNKIAHPVNDLNSLTNLLRRVQKKKPFIRNNAKHYCDTVGTIYEGRSAVLAANFIKKIID